MSSLERLGEAGWLPDVRSEESIAGQACNQPARPRSSLDAARPASARPHVSVEARRSRACSEDVVFCRNYDRISKSTV